uniref:Uncharacterized protein n=1 Tax=Ciona intestinalis TaxID=7719 RepID=H2XRH5_CIOIN
MNFDASALNDQTTVVFLGSHNLHGHSIPGISFVSNSCESDAFIAVRGGFFIPLMTTFLVRFRVSPANNYEVVKYHYNYYTQR